MGSCCNSVTYPEIDNANSIDQLITALTDRKAISLETIEKYEKALSAKTNPVDDESRTLLTNRIEYLKKCSALSSAIVFLSITIHIFRFFQNGYSIRRINLKNIACM